MKKIYSMLALAAVSFSAATAYAGTADQTFGNRVPARKVISKEMNNFPTQTVANKGRMVKGMRKADSSPTIEGAWTFMLGDFYFDYSEGSYIPGYYIATMEGNDVTFTPLDEKMMPMLGVYDPENLTVTFKRAYQGIEQGYYVFQYPYIFDPEKPNPDTGELGDIDEVESIVGTYNVEDGLLEFEPDYGLAWAGYDNMLGQEDGLMGYFAIYDLLLAFHFDASESVSGEWEPIGNATFMDGWLVPAMGLNQKDEKNQYQLLLEQSVDNKYVYRLVNPYFNGPVAQYNGYENGDGYIVFDISDPDHVLFLPANAGFLNYAIIPGGIYDFYCYNMLGSLVVSYPDYTLDEIISLQTGYIPFTTFKNGVVSLTSINTAEGTLYDATFGTQNDPFGGGTWSNNGKTVNMDASITFPLWYDAEVGAIAVDEAANPEYYNLNGVRLSNPEKGQIVIKRAGGVVTKEIIR